ncbi:DUF4199 domain-containing protein [Limibacter armeniacum]|uniref:DUF4199 domain-containing protein n=1 Tax=Limibacter armeniacum TaxID=466084 RepID=UPI002FE5C0E4
MNKQLFTTGIVAGILAAIACFLYILVLHGLDLNPFGRYKYMYLGLYGVFFAGGMWYYRDRQNNYKLRAQGGIVLGFTLNIVASVVYMALLYGLMQYVDSNHGIISIYKQEAITVINDVKQMMQESLTPEKFKEQFEAFEQQYKAVQNITPSELALDQSMGMFMAGTFLTFLFMLIMKKS